ncbi:choice-of-anchor P family protein [Streptomyces sp. CA-106131]|uniref:choice-of-anchor P family protein n=1 Tax=Streptomyces sp. CA-106131 TaxID=3240045 RepID=UPI003D8D6945
MGSVTMSLAIAGSRVVVPTAPNSAIPFPGGGRIVVNEQSPAPKADSGLTVRAVHIMVPGVSGQLVDIAVGTATSAAHNCR